MSAGEPLLTSDTKISTKKQYQSENFSYTTGRWYFKNKNLPESISEPPPIVKPKSFPCFCLENLMQTQSGHLGF